MAPSTSPDDAPHPPPQPPPPAPPLTTQVWDWICWTGAKTYDGLDFAGEVLANFLGLTQSEYQWMIELKEREKEEKQQRRLEAKQRRQLKLEELLVEEKRKLQELEHGSSNQSEVDVTV